MSTLRIRPLLVVTGFFLLPGLAFSQGSPPPIHGVTGTVATEGTMKTVYRGLNTIIVTTVDGLEHAYRFTKDLVVHGGKSPDDPLAGLKEGAMVVIHYSTEGGEPTVVEIDQVGDEGLLETEGRITKIDRGKKQIDVQIGESRTETFQLTDRAAAETAKEIQGQAAGGTAKIVIYYKDENGRKVVHYVKKVP